MEPAGLGKSLVVTEYAKINLFWATTVVTTIESDVVENEYNGSCGEVKVNFLIHCFPILHLH